MSLIWTGQDKLAPSRGIWNGARGALIVWAVVIFSAWAVPKLINFAIEAYYGWRP